MLGGIKVSPNWNFEDLEEGGHRVPFEDAGITIRSIILNYDHSFLAKNYCELRNRPTLYWLMTFYDLIGSYINTVPNINSSKYSWFYVRY